MELDFLACEREINKGRKHFHMMVKPIGPVCNLRCTYCYYLEKTNIYAKGQSKASEYRMSDEVLENYIKNYIKSQPTENPRVVFAWQGGEPTLLGVEFFEKAVELQQKHTDGRRIENTLQTNGMFIDERWTAFFRKHNFLIGISIDGPQDLHDAYRRNQSGEGSWKRVMKSITLLKKSSVAFNTLTVVNNLNAQHPLRVYNFLKSIGSTWMQFIPIQERRATDKSEALRLVANDYVKEAVVTKESVTPEQWGGFLIQVFDKWVREDVGEIFIKQFDCALEAWCGYNPTACVHSKYCGEGLVMEHNGDVYSCDHYVYPQFKLGNIMTDKLLDLANSSGQQKFGELKYSTLSKQCLSCKYLAACNGECPKHRFIENGAREKVAYLCKGYYAFYDHVAPYMHAMRTLLKQGREASEIKNILKMEINNH